MLRGRKKGVGGRGGQWHLGRAAHLLFEEQKGGLGCGHTADPAPPLHANPGNHTPPPSEYGFDQSATHASSVEAGCAPSTHADIDLGKRNRELFPDSQWWSADVDGVAKDLTVEFIRNATKAG